MRYCITISFNFDGDFLDKISKIKYDTYEIEVVSGGDKKTHNIIVPLKIRSHYPIAFRAACRFLNELCWFNRVRIVNVMAIHGNGRPTIHERNSLRRQDTLLIHNYKQRIVDKYQHLALGFFREGFSASSPYYMFLSYFKILNIRCKTGSAHKKWINDNLCHIVKSAYVIKEIGRKGFTDVGAYLYHNGRNALAHANVQKREPIVDMSSFDQWQSIVWGNALLEELVEHFLINELSVPQH